MSCQGWGPASALAIAMELEERRGRALWLRDLNAQMWGQTRIHVPYTLPSYELRRRAMYGGRKGRRAVQRLKARGCRPMTEALWT